MATTTQRPARKKYPHADLRRYHDRNKTIAHQALRKGMCTVPYRLLLHTRTMRRGDKVRAASKQVYVGGRGYVSKTYIWKQPPATDFFAPETADVIVETSLFEAWLEAGLIEEETDWGQRRDGQDLHQTLGREGIQDHYAYASDVLGKDVDHFRQLSREEIGRVGESALIGSGRDEEFSIGPL